MGPTITSELPKEAAYIIDVLVQLSDDEFIIAFEQAQNLSDQLTNKRSIENETNLSLYSNKMLMFELLKILSLYFNSKEESEVHLQKKGLQKDRSEMLCLNMETNDDRYKNERKKLLDLQWKFGVIAGSSDSTDVGTTVIQARLEMEDSKGIHRFEHIEMSLQKFYEFLHQLTKAKATMANFNNIK